MTMTLPGDESLGVKVLVDFRYRTQGNYKWTATISNWGVFYNVVAGPTLEKKIRYVKKSLKRPASEIAADGDA